MLDKEQTIERLCKLATLVMEVKYAYTKSADCFCKDSTHTEDSFRMEEDIIKFIEDAVKEKLS